MSVAIADDLYQRGRVHGVTGARHGMHSVQQKRVRRCCRTEQFRGRGRSGRRQSGSAGWCVPIALESRHDNLS